MCKEKKERRREELMKEAREAKTQDQVWKIINRERNRKAVINIGISMEEWDEYFRNLLYIGRNRKEDEVGRERRK